jgi:hypothetical protein
MRERIKAWLQTRLTLALLVPALVGVALLVGDSGSGESGRRELVPVWSLHRPAVSPTFRDENGEAKPSAVSGNRRGGNRRDEGAF